MKSEDAKKVDDNGFWEIERNPITKTGIFDYLGSECGYGEPEQIVKVLKHEDALKDKDFLDGLRGKPIIFEHHWLGHQGKDANEELVVGAIGDDVIFEDGTVFANLHIFSKEAQRLIENGIAELSLGSKASYYDECGDGYDVTQYPYAPNHLALVPNARLGHELRVLDSKKIMEETMGFFNKKSLDEEVKVEAEDADVTNIEEKVGDSDIDTRISTLESEHQALRDGQARIIEMLEAMSGSSMDEEESEVSPAKMMDEEEVEARIKDAIAKVEEDKAIDTEIKEEIIEDMKSEDSFSMDARKLSTPELVRYAMDCLDIKNQATSDYKINARIVKATLLAKKNVSSKNFVSLDGANKVSIAVSAHDMFIGGLK